MNFSKLNRSRMRALNTKSSIWFTQGCQSRQSNKSVLVGRGDFSVHRWCANLKSRVMSDYVLENNRDQCLRRSRFLIAAPIKRDRRQFATNLRQRRPFLCKTISGGCSSGRRSLQNVLEEFRFRRI